MRISFLFKNLIYLRLVIMKQFTTDTATPTPTFTPPPAPSPAWPGWLYSATGYIIWPTDQPSALHSPTACGQVCFFFNGELPPHPQGFFFKTQRISLQLFKSLIRKDATEFFLTLPQTGNPLFQSQHSIHYDEIWGVPKWLID